MSGFWISLKLACRLPWYQLAKPEAKLLSGFNSSLLHPVGILKSRNNIQTCVTSWLITNQHGRTFATYKPYPEYEETPSPYKKRQPYRYGYQYKFYKGGLLPRPEGELENEPVKGLPKWNPRKCDQWVERKALFGQNDYIDILGDGNIHPAQLIQGPSWLRGFKGNEMQRLIRQLQVKGKYLQEMYPSRHHNIIKRIFYWHKQYNTQRRHAPFWGRGRKRNRIHDLDSTPR